MSEVERLDLNFTLQHFHAHYSCFYIIIISSSDAHSNIMLSTMISSDLSLDIRILSMKYILNMIDIYNQYD